MNSLVADVIAEAAGSSGHNRDSLMNKSLVREPAIKKAVTQFSQQAQGKESTDAFLALVK